MEQSEFASTPPPARGYCWRPTMDLAPGMVIAKPVVGAAGGRATMLLAAGGLITAETIAQLVNKGVACVAVVDSAPADEKTRADAARRFEARLHEIFGADPDTHCRALFDALIADGPPPCQS